MTRCPNCGREATYSPADKAFTCTCGHDPKICPCEGEEDDPGPHLASCPFNDPNYEG